MQFMLAMFWVNSHDIYQGNTYLLYILHSIKKWWTFCGGNKNSSNYSYYMMYRYILFSKVIYSFNKCNFHLIFMWLINRSMEYSRSKGEKSLTHFDYKYKGFENKPQCVWYIYWCTTHTYFVWKCIFMA